MTRKTFFIIIIIILLVVFLAIGGYFLWQLQHSSTTQPLSATGISGPAGTTGNTSPPATSIGTSNISTLGTLDITGSTLSVGTRGESVPVSNFYKNPQTQVLDPQNDAVVKEDPAFAIGFYTKDQSFFITLKGADLQTDRTAAEKEFLNHLNISKEQACKLTVSLMVPASVSRNASGVDYGLSFCPNGKPMPTNIGPTESQNWP